MTEKKIEFEEAMTELETVVRQLESGKVKLDDAVKAYERGIELKNICEKQLQQAKLVVEKLTLDKNATPIDVEEFNERPQR